MHCLQTEQCQESFTQIDEKQNIEFWRQNGIKFELMNKILKTVPEDFFFLQNPSSALVHIMEHVYCPLMSWPLLLPICNKLQKSGKSNKNRIPIFLKEQPNGTTVAACVACVFTSNQKILVILQLDSCTSQPNHKQAQPVQGYYFFLALQCTLAVTVFPPFPNQPSCPSHPPTHQRASPLVRMPFPALPMSMPSLRSRFGGGCSCGCGCG